jgi:hypothetical protein
MKLSIKILENVSSVNHWNYASEATLQEGDVNEIYLQVVDSSKQVPINDSQWPLRYMLKDTPSLTAEFPSIDDAQVFEIVATQPYPEDSSIWKLSFASNKTPKAGAFKITIVEGSISRSFIVNNMLVVEYLNIGSC